MSLFKNKPVHRIALCFCFVLVLTCVATERGKAQVLYGSIVGNAKDSSAAVSGATVTMTHKETNLSRDSLTNNTSEYTLANMLLGNYTVKVSLTGFKEFAKTDAWVTVNTITWMSPWRWIRSPKPSRVAALSCREPTIQCEEVLK